jgi:hypothetical protein
VLRTVAKKTCAVCKQAKRRRAFAKDVSRSDKKMRLCRVCSNAKNKAWRAKNKEKAAASCVAWAAANPEKKREAHRRYREARPHLNRHKALLDYGLTLEWFTAHLKALGNACERCHTPFRNLGNDCHVDHDHLHCGSCDTGRGSCRNPDAVRGLLCQGCSIKLTRRWEAANPHDPYLVAYRARRAALDTPLRAA